MQSRAKKKMLTNVPRFFEKFPMLAGMNNVSVIAVFVAIWAISRSFHSELDFLNVTKLEYVQDFSKE